VEIGIGDRDRDRDRDRDELEQGHVIRRISGGDPFEGLDHDHLDVFELIGQRFRVPEIHGQPHHHVQRFSLHMLAELVFRG
jgi:hypothetical protein